ncbi:MAG: type VI secretion system baseplate subunit TssG [Bryobacteraceae bacterium]
MQLLLEKEPWEFEFYQAVRLMKSFRPDRNPVGEFGSPEREIVHFGANPSMAFPASQIQKLLARPGQVPFMIVNFFGLFGPSGVLPLCYTELVMDRVRAGDHALRDFLDIFNHRIISLLYRGWEKYRIPATADRPQNSPVREHLLELIGLGIAELRNRQSLRDDAFVFYGGLFALQPRSATALRQVLSDYFNLPVEVEQFVAAWYRIDDWDQCCLGARDTRSEMVGSGAIIGDEILDRSSRILIRLGPLTLAQYLDFLPGAYRPGSSARKVLEDMTRFFVGDALDVDLQLILKGDEVPRCELGAPEMESPQLGWSTWIKSAPFSRNPGEVVMRLT